MAAADVKIRFSIFGDSTKAELAKLSKTFTNFGRDLGRLGSDMTRAFTIPLAGLATAAFKFSSEASGHFKKFAERTSQAMGRLGTDISRSIDLKGKLDTLAGWLESAVRGFQDLGPHMKAFVVNLGLIAALSGPVLAFVGKLSVILGTMIRFLAGPAGIVLLVGALATAVYGVSAAIKDASDKTSGWHSLLTEEERRISAVNSKYAEAVEHLKKLTLLRSDVAKGGTLVKPQDMGPRSVGGGSETVRGAPVTLRGGAVVAALDSAIAAQKAAVEKTLPTLEKLTGRSGITGAIQQGVEFAAVKTTEFLDTLEVNTFEAARRINEHWKKVHVEMIEGWNNWFHSADSAIASLKAAAVGLFQTFTSGFAAAIGQALILGQDFGQAMSGVFASVAQAGINMIVQILFQWVAAKITEIVTGAVAAHSSIPFVGIAIGLAAAAAGIAGARALASKEGGHAFAEGGIVTGPVRGLVGEAGPEAIIPLKPSVLERMGLGGRGGQPIQFIIDGRVIAEALLPHHGRALRFHGVPG